MSGLTPEQVDKFYKDGFLILPDELSKETVEGLLRESKDLLESTISTPLPLAFPFLIPLT